MGGNQVVRNALEKARRDHRVKRLDHLARLQRLPPAAGGRRHVRGCSLGGRGVPRSRCETTDLVAVVFASLLELLLADAYYVEYEPVAAVLAHARFGEIGRERAAPWAKYKKCREVSSRDLHK